ncbi:MAG: MSMEG_1061 family FMN-dependent PPOX-type flavoprotein [Trinickia sp.]|uniref:MSMEG_1061 family FMN-dependent PPOX-type flavoprotein n=1 Tax=Trinickia sp. TaxID=2571163 RepID=UPI003F81D6EC
MSTVPFTAADLDLDRLYDPPSESIAKGVLPRLMPFHLDYLRVATFVCLATGSADGLDASPRGGEPGFVKALNDKTIAFADWPGNNRIASLRNLTHDARIGMLFLFPGLEMFMRINGRGAISTNAALLARLSEGAKTPKAAVVVTIDEVLFHCGKAINRAKLWSEAARIDRSSVPSPGQIKSAMSGLDPAGAEAIDAGYLQAVRNDLY